MNANDETRELVLQLEIAEAEERKEKVSGKARAGSIVTDEQLALKLHLEELERSRQILGDDHLAQSIAHAIGTDANILALYREIDAMEAADRTLAVNLSAPGAVGASARSTLRRQEPAAVLRPPEKVRQTSAPSASGSKQSIFIHAECTICMEPIGKKTHLQVPCGHFYDEKCLVALIQKASKDESIFPPRCCKKPIPQESFLPFLARDIRTAFTKSAAEFSTRPRDRVYCSNPVCSEFLTGNRSTTVQSIQCPQCARITCELCREAAHPGVLVCKPEKGSSLQALVEEKKWQRCPECHSVIELAQGCYHITCRCAAQFCYLCATPWKTCTCPQWEEQLLIAEAERRVDAELVFGEDILENITGTALQRQGRIERMTNRLREDHECEHDWNFSKGAGTCSSCSTFYLRYLLQCSNCYIEVCVPCQRNRM